MKYFSVSAWTTYKTCSCKKYQCMDEILKPWTENQHKVENFCMINSQVIFTIIFTLHSEKRRKTAVFRSSIDNHFIDLAVFQSTTNNGDIIQWRLLMTREIEPGTEMWFRKLKNQDKICKIAACLVSGDKEPSCQTKHTLEKNVPPKSILVILARKTQNRYFPIISPLMTFNEQLSRAKTISSWW